MVATDRRGQICDMFRNSIIGFGDRLDVGEKLEGAVPGFWLEQFG